MLNMIITVIVVIATLAILLMNIGLTRCFLGAPPRGDAALSLVVPFFGMVGVVLLLSLAALLACFRISSSGFAALHSNTTVAGALTVALTFGSALAGAIAFMLWCEPRAAGKALWGVIVPIEILLGVIGPMVFACWFLMALWDTKGSIAGSQATSTSLKTLFWCVVVLAIPAYSLSGIFLWHSMSYRVVRRVNDIKREVQQLAASGGHGLKPIASQMELEMANASPDAPLDEFVGLLPDAPRHRKLNDKARAIVIERALKVPNFNEAFRKCMQGRDYIYRQGAAELLQHVSQDQLHAHKEEWGQALIIGVRQTADGVYCRPSWLTEHFDMNPDPMAHVSSLLAAAQRFEDWSGYPLLQKEFQAIADATLGLNDDKHLPKFLKLLANAGYTPGK